MPKENDKIISTKLFDKDNSGGGEDFLLNCIPKDLLFGLLNNPYESLIVIDKRGIVRFVSSSIERLSAMKRKDIIGRHTTEVRPHTRLHKILRTRKPETDRSKVPNDKIITRIPLFKDGRIMGAMGKRLFMNPKELRELYDKVSTLETCLDYYKTELYQMNKARRNFASIIGNSKLIREAKAMALKAACADSPVMIVGESGTGKELFANAIQQASNRAGNPFIKVNCASIPNELIESELFGYEPGSFTGAHPRGKIGKFEMADTGTIFLDEIGDMPLNMQVKLLRVIQQNEIERVGSNKPRRIDFRVITATNQDLERQITKGSFRLDLFYRINVIIINLPKLRDIKEDIPILAHHFLSELNKKTKKNVKSISKEAEMLLNKYPWPGNVRELRNTLERAMIFCEGNRIEVEDLSFRMQTPYVFNFTRTNSAASLRNVVEHAEEKAIIEALKIAGSNKAAAAKLLGIHRTGLYQKMKKYRLL